LSCGKFVTTKEYAPRLRARREREMELVAMRNQTAGSVKSSVIDASWYGLNSYSLTWAKR
jgi:hypothetical protein